MTAYERSGWRDIEISERHRTWGFDVPAVNSDFLLIEYDHAQPRAMVEYRHEMSVCDFTKWKHDANMLANSRLRGWMGEQLPYLGVRYYPRPGQWRFDVHFLDGAPGYVDRLDVAEWEYVSLLYLLRGRKMPAGLAQRLRMLDRKAVS